MKSGGSSPWGEIQTSHPFVPGVRFVTTAGHGGYLVGKSFAKKNLSESVRAIGSPWGNYYVFEEDCAFAAIEIGLLEHENFGNNFVEYLNKMFGNDRGKESYIESRREIMNRWYPIEKSLERVQTLLEREAKEAKQKEQEKFVPNPGMQFRLYNKEYEIVGKSQQGNGYTAVLIPSGQRYRITKKQIGEATFIN
jgi:hypothetical protein